MILFEREPMKFEFVQLMKDAQTKIALNRITVSEKFAAHVLDLQIATISILQERTLSINQRLIVLCFFVDRVEEICAGELDELALTKLIATYESKNFLTEQVPRMLASVNFNAEKFVALILILLETFYSDLYLGDERKFTNTVADTLELNQNENFVSLATVVASYERLADERKNFLSHYSTFLENYLVNEIFLNICPWLHAEHFTKTFISFAISYKIFELMMFSATRQGLNGKDDLLRLTSWYTLQMDHTEFFKEKISKYLEDFDDLPTLMDTLFEY